MKNHEKIEPGKAQAAPKLPDASQIAEISHDLKTFLNPIMGFSSVLLQDQERLQEDQLRQVSLIYESAHRLLDRIDAMVELFRLLGGAIQPNIGDCDAHHVCQQVAARLSGVLVNRLQASLHLLLPDQHLYCKCDPQMLSRCIGEIVLHRLGVVDSGQVRLSYGLLPGDDSRLEFLIADDGPPVAGKERHALERFLAEDAGTNTPAKGLGLWILLARQAARASKASITLPADGRGHFAVVVELGTSPRGA